MYLKTYRLIILTFVLILPLIVLGQQKRVRHSDQQWVQYYNQLKLSPSWMLMADGGFRWADKFSTKTLIIARVGMAYNINSHLRVAAGLASTAAYSSSSFSKLEYRPYQELFASYRYNNVNLQHRFRLEERYFKNVVDGNVQAGHDFNFRFRYQLAFNIPIVKLSASKPDQILLLNVTDEIFINAGSEVVYNILDKNRFCIGPVFQQSKNLSIGLSYLHQYSQLNEAAAYEHNNVAWLTIRHFLHLNIPTNE